MNVQTPFSKWLDEQLLKHGLTGKDFANLIGVSEATVSRIRTGKKALSPRMRALLSTGLKVPCQEIPDATLMKEQVPVHGELPAFYLLRSAIPDHTLLNYADEQGVFARNGLETRLIPELDAGRHFPSSYASAINRNLAEGNVVLVMGPGTTLEEAGAKATKSIFSHTYKGYAFIARATTHLPALENSPPKKRLFTLKHILEHLDEVGLWRSGNIARFSWLSEMDQSFINAVRGLAKEMLTGEKYVPTQTLRTPEKSGIDCLHDMGDYGADIAVADAGSLGRAYQQGDKYSVILTLSDLQNTINSIDVSAPPSWARHIKKAYYSDKAETAIERFKHFWMTELSRLESAIDWHLFVPAGIEQDTVKLMQQRLVDVKNELDHAIANPERARNMKQWVRDYIHEHLSYDDTLTGMDAFERAWQSCYGGL